MNQIFIIDILILIDILFFILFWIIYQNLANSISLVGSNKLREFIKLLPVSN